jgi:hypothetical protein
MPSSAENGIFDYIRYFFCGWGVVGASALKYAQQHLRNTPDDYKDGHGLREDDGRYARGAKTSCFGDNLKTLLGERPHPR